MNQDFLSDRLKDRKSQHNFRQLQINAHQIDFCSNDYLGIASQKRLPIEAAKHTTGSTGSRLISGNYELLLETEQLVAEFHNSPAGLIYNSGYDANIGLLSCLPKRGDTILFDRLSHASIRDGIRLSLAQSRAFAHNDIDDLRSKIRHSSGNTFVITESVFSMDGELAPLLEIARTCSEFGAHLIVDEAHATGVIGDHGEGLVQFLGCEALCLARIHTFGKAVGCHGAIVLGTSTLRDFLINFSRAFIYTTSLPPLAIDAIKKSYELFPKLEDERRYLMEQARHFREANIPFEKLSSPTPIQGIIIPGNEKVRLIASLLQARGFDIRPISYPSVPKQRERLRITLHSFNTNSELESLADNLIRLAGEL